jgi:hypothetical protein
MLYIDGLNLKSIGNILCFVGIIVAIIGLFNTWYVVSYEFSSQGLAPELDTYGMTDLLSFDGINGLQVVTPGTNGFTPMGNIAIPLSLIIGIGLLFLVISSIGIHLSRKLGYKYLWRGIRLLIPFILIIVLLFALKSFMPTVPSEAQEINEIIDSFSSSPFGGETQTLMEVQPGLDLPLTVQWGLGLGAQLLIIAAIIIIISGILEVTANKQFYETKIPVDKKGKKAE